MEEPISISLLNTSSQFLPQKSTSTSPAAAVMEELILRRTRAKTPVFRVGQLESQQPQPQPQQQQRPSLDYSQALAERYQALLPARLMSPFVETETTTTTAATLFSNFPSSVNVPIVKPAPAPIVRTIRKIKRQGSLRSLMKRHSRDGSISDSDTLVGSTPTSPLSPSFPGLKKQKMKDPFEKHVMFTDEDEFYVNSPTSSHSSDNDNDSDNDMALEMCMELLTKELSTVCLSREPILEDEEEGEGENPPTSGLQVLLMIESFEKVQQNLRQKIHRSPPDDRDSALDVERTLRDWLKVLYSVYDRAHERERELDCDGSINEEDFPLPLSVGSNRLPALPSPNVRYPHPHGRSSVVSEA